MAAGEGPTGIAASGFNNDGYHDVMTANWPGNSVSVLLGSAAADEPQGHAIMRR
jgi:hypothetical protein